MGLNRKPRTILSIKGRVMKTTANLKQVFPTVAGGTRADITQLGGQARGKESLGKSSPEPSRSHVPDTPGKGPLNAAGKGKGNDTTSLG